MSLTILEWAKLNQNPLESGVVEIFARNNPILERMPFMNISGNAYSFNRELTLPGVEWRGLYEAYTESTGTREKVSEDLFMLGGDLDVDKFLIDTQTDNNVRAVEVEMKTKAMAQQMMHTFLRGDNSANAKVPDGLNVKLAAASREMEAGTNGAELSLAMLDEALDNVAGAPGVILCNRVIRRKINSLVRAAGQASETVSDVFGRTLTAYAGVPIVTVDNAEWASPILPFDETQGTDTATTSLYVLNLGADGVHGIQSAPMSVRDLGEIDTKEVFRTRVSWFANPVVLKNVRAALRLKGIAQPA